MKTKDIIRLGVPFGKPMDEAFKFISAFCTEGGNKENLGAEISAIVAAPGNFVDDLLRGPLASALQAPDLHMPGKPPAPWKQWGTDIDDMARKQIEAASLLPISVAAALMPDAHVGYGLPIGGVLATENAVIPYAVGVDIACRMKMSVLDLPTGWLNDKKDRLAEAIEKEARFGVGSTFKDRRAHDVLDEDWSVSPVTAKNKERAWAQLGTSGSGNHFVEFGLLTVTGDGCGLEPGEYVALLSHSGSRGTGAAVCDHYSKLATAQHNELPKELSRLAWLSLDSSDGQEYWAAMNLMGRYAAANHALIHKHITENLGVEVLLDVENHHNFAWKEVHLGWKDTQNENSSHRRLTFEHPRVQSAKRALRHGGLCRGHPARKAGSCRCCGRYRGCRPRRSPFHRNTKCRGRPSARDHAREPRFLVEQHRACPIFAPEPSSHTVLVRARPRFGILSCSTARTLIWARSLSRVAMLRAL